MDLKCRLGFCAKLGIAVHKRKREMPAQQRRSSCCIFTFLCLSLLHLVQVKQIVKVK